MKCPKCKKEYPSIYYFEDETTCRECFKSMQPESSQIPPVIQELAPPVRDHRSPGEIAREKAAAAGRPDDWQDFLPSEEKSFPSVPAAGGNLPTPQAPHSKAAISQQSASASKVMAPRMAKTYPNLISAGEMQAAYGRFVKGIGIAIGVIGAIAGLIAADKGGIGGAFVVWGLALPIALIIHVIGTFVAAAGEAMQALADIATNSWPKQG
jgi:hypothetical protein